MSEKSVFNFSICFLVLKNSLDCQIFVCNSKFCINFGLHIICSIWSFDNFHVSIGFSPSANNRSKQSNGVITCEHLCTVSFLIIGCVGAVSAYGTEFCTYLVSSHPKQTKNRATLPCKACGVGALYVWCFCCANAHFCLGVPDWRRMVGCSCQIFWAAGAPWDRWWETWVGVNNTNM